MSDNDNKENRMIYNYLKKKKSHYKGEGLKSKLKKQIENQWFTTRKSVICVPKTSGLHFKNQRFINDK